MLHIYKLDSQPSSNQTAVNVEQMCTLQYNLPQQTN